MMHTYGIYFEFRPDFSLIHITQMCQCLKINSLVEFLRSRQPKDKDFFYNSTQLYLTSLSNNIPAKIGIIIQSKKNIFLPFFRPLQQDG